MTSSSSTAREPWWQRCDRFVEEISARCRADAGDRADLKSGLRKPVTRCSRMHSHLARYVSPQWSLARQQPYYTVAAMIADNSRQPVEDGQETADEASAGGQPAADGELGGTSVSGPERDGGDRVVWQMRLRQENLGASLARGVRLPGKQALNQDTAEQRLHLLTRSSSRTVHARLPDLTRYLRSRGVAVDWAVLLNDLIAWDQDRDETATRWLQAFYRPDTAVGGEESPAVAGADSP